MSSFAGFNSGNFVKGRLQAALYTMRKKNRLRRGGGDTPPPEPQEIIFGAQTLGGDGNWGPGTDRAMFRRLTLVTPNNSDITIKAVHLGNRATGPGEFIKGLVYTDIGGAAPVGDLLGVSTPQSMVPTGYIRCPLSDIIIPSGTNVYAGAVWSDGAFQAEFDSETVPVAPNTLLYNGTISYADPPAVAPDEVTASYANTLACYLECTYIP